MKKLDLNGTMEAMDGMRYKLDGVAGTMKLYANQFGSLNLSHHASKAGKSSKQYREMRRKLGDDYTTDFEGTYPDSLWEKAEKMGLFRYMPSN